jgi:hypothetical protein
VGNKQIVLNNTDDTSRAEGIIAFIETETVANNYVKKEIFPHQKHEY